MFAALSGLLNLNTLLSFLFLISLYEWVFLIGIYLNIKKNFNIKIFSIITIIFLSFSNDFSTYAFETIFIIFLPYILFFISNFFKTYKIKFLTFISISLFVQFCLGFNYLIIIQIYFTFLIFIIFLIFEIKRNKFRIFQLLKLENKLIEILTFISSIIFFIFFGLYIKEIFLIDSEYFNAINRNIDSTVSFEIFKDYAKILPNEFIYTLFFGSLINFNFVPKEFVFSFGSIFLFSFYLYFLEFKKNKKFELEEIIIIIFFILFIFVISEFEFIDYVIYNLPFVEYVRHKDYIINFVKPLSLIFIYIQFTKINSKVFNDDKKIYNSLFLIFYFGLFLKFFIPIIYSIILDFTIDYFKVLMFFNLIFHLSFFVI